MSLPHTSFVEALHYHNREHPMRDRANANTMNVHIFTINLREYFYVYQYLYSKNMYNQHTTPCTYVACIGVGSQTIASSAIGNLIESNGFRY